MSQKFLNGINMAGTPIDNLPDAVSAAQPVTKQQLDAAIQGYSWKQPVRMVATTNITLSGIQTIDGVAGAANDRVLLTGQSAPAQNGPYAMAAGAWTRTTDMDTGAEAVGATFFVSEGTTNGNSQWNQTADAPITLGTTALVFAKIGGGTSYTQGTGITITGSVIAVDPAVVTKKSAATIGDGTATAITMTHGLGTVDVQVTVREVSTGDEVKVDNRATSTTQVLLTFALAPTTGQYRVIVQG